MSQPAWARCRAERKGTWRARGALAPFTEQGPRGSAVLAPHMRIVSLWGVNCLSCSHLREQGRSIWALRFFFSLFMTSSFQAGTYTSELNPQPWAMRF